MINYEEEIEKIQPCLDVDEIESGGIYTGSDRYRGYLQEMS